MFIEAISSNARKDEPFSVLREVSLVTQAEPGLSLATVNLREEVGCTPLGFHQALPSQRSDHFFASQKGKIAICSLLSWNLLITSRNEIC